MQHASQPSKLYTFSETPPLTIFLECFFQFLQNHSRLLNRIQQMVLRAGFSKLKILEKLRKISGASYAIRVTTCKNSLSDWNLVTFSWFSPKNQPKLNLFGNFSRTSNYNHKIQQQYPTKYHKIQFPLYPRGKPLQKTIKASQFVVTQININVNFPLLELIKSPRWFACDHCLELL